jgi:hypothetical protein
MRTDRRYHFQCVPTLLIDLAAGQPFRETREQQTAISEAQDRQPAPLLVEQRLPDLGEVGSQAAVENAFGHSGVEGGADVDHRIGHGGVEFFGAMWESRRKT